MAFAGFDTYACPNPLTLGWLKANTNLTWAAGYLAPAPSHPDMGWMDHGFADARAAGFGLLPIFVGQQEADGPGSHSYSAAQGQADGADTAALMVQAGFPPGSTVVLDIEQGDALEGDRSEYTVAWALAVQLAGFHPGIYCSHIIAASVHTALEDANVDAPFMFPFKVDTVASHAVSAPYSTEDPAELSGFPAAQACQCEQNAEITVGSVTMTVDLSTCLFADPSAP